MPLRRAHPESRGAEASDEVPRPDLDNPDVAKRRIELRGYVVVVEVEASLGNASLPRDGMEFLERGVAHEMTPDSSVSRPQGRVDEGGHPPTLRRR